MIANASRRKRRAGHTAYSPPRGEYRVRRRAELFCYPSRCRSWAMYSRYVGTTIATESEYSRRPSNQLSQAEIDDQWFCRAHPGVMLAGLVGEDPRCCVR